MVYFLIISLTMIAGYILGYFFNKNKHICDWFDREYTTCIKGIAILTVLWAHVGKVFSIPFIQFIAGIGVSLFLICSGYGLERSFEKNRFKNFWSKRIHSVYLPLVIVICVVSFIKLTFIHNFDIVVFLKAVFLVSVNWYIRFLCVCYLAFFFIKKIVSGSNRIKELYLWILFITMSYFFYSILIDDVSAPFLEARQVLSFPFGVYLAKQLNKEYECTDKKRWFLITIILGVVGLLFMGITQTGEIKHLPYVVSNAMALFTCFPLALSLLCFSYIYPRIICNNFLYIIGTISYELFLVQQQILGVLNQKYSTWIVFTVMIVLLPILLHMIVNKKWRPKS